MPEPTKPTNIFPQMEEDVLKFWEANKIFEKSVERAAPQGDYVFYDGPPFATGTPHYGHIVGSIMKDSIPRYWTMRGYRVERKWGWDCHGLPIENIVEKELGSQCKRDMENIGVEKFNALCRERVLDYVHEWEKIIPRLGRWADMRNSYRTMDLPYMESVWRVFKDLWDKNLIYEGFRSMHICPRCETTLSQSEVAEGYRDIKDLSVIAKFSLLDDPDTYILAWTTTPWTLIGNAALAVNQDINYQAVIIKGGNEKYIVAKERIADVFRDKEYDLGAEIQGKDLLGKSYRPLFVYYAQDEKLENRDNGWKIYAADFVSTDEGTGIVHIAPAFGEDDLKMGQKNSLPFIQHVAMDGSIKPEAADFSGMNVKPKGDHTTTDIEIIKYLSRHNLLFHKEKYEHSYPHCWRCDTPLINYATTSWFVKISAIKENILKNAEDINWSPEHIKKGRFGSWLEGARDWSISRQRFWASVMPIWKCDKCQEVKVFGSIHDLEEISGQKVTDLHKDVVDKIVFGCSQCSGEMHRIPDVLDTWFDSGSMPYAQMHYPFENKAKFESNFPAQFIAEGQDQCRAWFYYLHVLATATKNTRAFSNVIVNGIVLAEDGKKMSKRLKNYPETMFLVDKYGADAIRFYLLSSPVMLAENLNFSEKGVEEALRKINLTLWNVYNFYGLFQNEISEAIAAEKNILDLWIEARLRELLAETTKNMDAYNLPKAVRPLEDFIGDLSAWYVRRSRERIKSGTSGEKNAALLTLRKVLLELSKIMAPFTPFIAENIWQRAAGYVFSDPQKSVHLEAWPLCDVSGDDRRIIADMQSVRSLCEQILSARDSLGIKVRQPLGEVAINFFPSEDYRRIAEEECNVRKISTYSGESLPEGEGWRSFGETLKLNVSLTPELKREGLKRELIRTINALRKKQGLNLHDRINLSWSAQSEIKEVFASAGEAIKKEVIAASLEEKPDDEHMNDSRAFDINGYQVVISIEKI